MPGQRPALEVLPRQLPTPLNELFDTEASAWDMPNRIESRRDRNSSYGRAHTFAGYVSIMNPTMEKYWKQRSGNWRRPRVMRGRICWRPKKTTSVTWPESIDAAPPS